MISFDIILIIVLIELSVIPTSFSSYHCMRYDSRTTRQSYDEPCHIDTFTRCATIRFNGVTVPKDAQSVIVGMCLNKDQRRMFDASCGSYRENVTGIDGIDAREMHVCCCGESNCNIERFADTCIANSSLWNNGNEFLLAITTVLASIGIMGRLCFIL